MCVYVGVLGVHSGNRAGFPGIMCHLSHSEPPELHVCTTVMYGAASLAT